MEKPPALSGGFGFFFQADDAIRNFHVTGVQTCALPIFDPVMIAKGGTSLIANDASEAIKNRLIGPHTHLLTPNIPEAEQLTGLTIATRQDMEKAGRSEEGRAAKRK